MVAIVAGNGLGLLNTSTSLLGDKGQMGEAALARTGERVYVNASTGNLVIQQQDEWLVGVGPDVGLSRTYNSLGAATDDNGDNWRLGLSRRISAVSGGTGANTAGSTVTRTGEDGAQTVYTWDASRSLYVSKDGAGAFDTLKYVAGSPAKWEWTDGDSRTVETYEVTANGQARLKSVRDTDGHSIEVRYVNDTTAAFLINQIETFNNGTGAGETVTIAYETGTGRTNNIQSITTVYKKDGQVQPEVKRVSYAYELYNTSQYRLKTVTVDLTPQNQGDAQSFVTTYGYLNTTSTLVSSLAHDIVNGTPQTVVLIGYINGKVSDIQEWTGRGASGYVTTRFTYQYGKTTIKDTLDRVTELHYKTAGFGQNLGQLARIVGPQVSRGEQDQVFEYDVNGNVTKITDGRGLSTVYGYDTNGNRIYERDAQNNVVRRTYSTTNQLLTQTVYVDLDPDAEGVGEPAAGLTTRYVYDSQEHLRFVVSAVGQVTEYRYAASGIYKGLRQSTLQYNVGRYDVSALGLQSALSLSSLENWASALADKSSMRVDYTYNSGGQLDKQTAFAKVDAVTGNGISDGTQSVSQYVYDQAGNLLQKIDGRGYEVANLDTAWARAQRKALGIVDGTGEGKLAASLTSADRTQIQQQAHYSTLYEFDGLNRITKVVEPGGGRTTLITYSSAALQTQVSLTNGLVTTSAYDRLGRVLSVIQGTSASSNSLGTTNYTYNVLGQLTSVTQPTGEKTYYLYDEMGRKVGEIDGEGALTEYTYNANGQLVRTYGYTNKVSASMLAAVEAGVVTGATPGLPMNLLSNANGMAQWPFSRVNAAATQITNSTSMGAVGSGTLEGETTLVIQQAANGVASASSFTSPIVGVMEGKRYEAQLWLGAVNATGNVYVEYLDATNVSLSKTLIGSQSGAAFPGGSALSSYKQFIYQSVAPAGATKMRLVAEKLTSTDNAQVSKLLVTHPVITEIPANQVATTTLRGDLRPKTTSASDLEEYRIYDKAGRLSKTVKVMGSGTFTMGSVVEYRYDGAGRLTDQVAYAGQLSSSLVSWIRNTRGELTAANGTIETSTGTITLATDYDDRRTRYFYDADGRQVGMLDADNYLSLQGYDAAGRLLYTRKYATPMEGVLADGNTLPVIIPSTSASPTSGAFVRVSSTDASAGGADQLTRYSYDSKGQLAAVIDPTSYATAYGYDAAGNLVKETRYARTAVTSSTNAVLLGAFSFDGVAYLKFYVNHLHPENRTTAYEYDANNRLTRKMEQPLGLETLYTYDSVGNLTKTVLAKGQVEERELQKQYDLLGRVVAELTAEGAKALVGKTNQAEIDAVWSQYATRHTYDTAGHRIATIEPNGVNGVGNKTVYYYDKAGRLTHSVNALGEVTQSVYDSFGRVLQSKRKATGLGASAVSTWTGGLISAAPSALKDLDWSLDEANSITSYTYERAGLLASSLTATNSKTVGGESSTYYYNAFGELRESYLPLWGGKRYARDHRGNITQTESTAYAVAWRSEQAQYDAFGRVFQRTDANGFTTEYRYDKRGRAIHVSNPINSAVSAWSEYGVQTTYDAFDRVTKTIDQFATETTYIYDTAARTTTMRILNGYAAQVTTTFDRLGQTVKVTDKLNNYTTFEYDADGRIKSTKRYAANGDLQTEEQTSYDLAGRIYETRDGKGIITRLSYDAANRVLSRVEDAAAGGLQLTTTYVYDGMGRVVWSKDAGGTWTHTEYDQDGRVTALVVDPASIPTGANNALQANPAAGGGLALRTELEYDQLGQQIKLVEGAGTAQARTTTYYYDEGGRRYQEVVDEGDASAGALNLTTLYYYDDNDNVVAKRDAKLQITRYTYNAANQLSHTIEADGSVTLMAYDARGQQTVTTRFAQRINTASLGLVLTEGDVAALVDLADEANHVNYQIYDILLQRLQYSIDALGYVTERVYDAVGNVAKVIAYASPVSTDALEVEETAEGAVNVTLWATPATNDSKDRVEQTFYDAANRPVWRIDAEGGVTQNTYDGNSRITQVKRFANPVTTVAEARTITSLPAGEVAISGTGLAAGDLTVVSNDSKDQVTYQVYDNAGRLTWSVDAEKYVTKYTYDGNDRLKTTTRYNTALSSYTAGSGAPNPVTHTNDATSTNTYDAAGRLTDAQNAELVTQRTAYDSVGRVTDVTQAYGDASQQVITHFDYDKAGRLVAETQAYGTGDAATTKYELDALGQRVKLIDPRGSEAATGTSAWAVAERVRILGGTTTTRAAALTAGSADYNTVLAAYTTTQVFDELGRIKQTTDALGGSIYTEYDAFGNAVKVTDPNGNAGYFYFDKNNQSTLHINPERYAVETTFDAFGQAKTITRLAEQLSSVQSTLIRPLLTFTAGKDAVTAIAHDKLGRQTQIQDAEGSSEYMAYDALGNKIEFTNKLGGKFTYTHDKRGRVLTEQLPVTVKQYQSNGSLKVNPATGGTDWVVINEYTYDARGNKLTSKEAKGLLEERNTSYKFDRLNRQIEQRGTSMDTFVPGTGTGTNVPVETRSYDKRGNLTEIVAADGGRTLAYWDALNRKVAEIQGIATVNGVQKGTLVTFEYSKANDLLAKKTFGSNVDLPTTAGGSRPADPTTTDVREVFYSYDASHRLVSTTQKNAFVGEVNAVTGNYEVRTLDLVNRRSYDANGNLIKETDARGNATWHYYDKAGNRLLQVDAERYISVWSYDAAGNIVSEGRLANRLPDGQIVNASTDVLTLLLAAGINDYRYVEMTRDRMGRIKEQRVTGVESASVNATNGSLTTSTADAVTLFDYNGLGQVTQKTEATGEVLNWQYDLMGRETQKEGAQFTDFENTSVRQTTQTEYNALSLVGKQTLKAKVASDDRVTQYFYGVNGLLERQELTLNATEKAITRYQYDKSGRISSQRMDRKNANAQVVTDITTYAYDLRGQQTKQTVYTLNGTNQTLVNGTAYTALQNQETRYNAFGDISGKRTYGATAPAASQWQEITDYDTAGRIARSSAGDGVMKYYAYDANGNTTLVARVTSATDNLALTTAAVIARNDSVFTLQSYDKRNQLSARIEHASTTSNPLQWVPNNTDIINSQWQVGAGIKVTNGPIAVGATDVNPLQGSAGALYGTYQIKNSFFKVGSGFFVDWCHQMTVTLPDTTALGNGNIRIKLVSFNVDYYYRTGLETYSSKYFYVDNLEKGGVWTSQPIRIGDTADGGVTGPGTINGIYPILDPAYAVIQKEVNGRYIDIIPIPNDNLSPWSTGSVTTTRDLRAITISGQPKDAKYVAMFVRSAGTSNSWLRVNPGQVSDSEIFVTDITSLGLTGNFEYKIFALSQNGELLNQQSGQINIIGTGGSNSSTLNPSMVGGQISAFYGTKLVLNAATGVYEQSTTKEISLVGLKNQPDAAVIRFRKQGATTWSQEFSLTATIPAGGTKPSYFSFIPADTAYGLTDSTAIYEFTVTSKTTEGTVLQRTFGQFKLNDVNSLSANLSEYKNLPSTVHFENLPNAATSARVVYRASNSSGSWTAQPLENTSAGSFDWITFDQNIVVNSSLTYPLDYEVQAFDAEGRMVHASGGKVNLGAVNQVVPNTGNSLMPASRYLTINPVISTGTPQTLRVYYRPAGKITSYTASGPITVGAPGLNGTGLFTFDANALMPSSTQTGEWDIYYEVFDSTSTKLTHANQPTATKPARLSLGTTTNPTATAMLLGVANAANIAQTTVKTNAYGEVASQTDARGFTTTLRYNSMGRLIEKIDPATDVTNEQGVTATQTSTSTKYFYDLQGRLIGTEDANQNRNTQLLLSAGEGVSIIAKEFHADGGIKRNAYDQQGNLRHTSNELSANDADTTYRTSYEYDRAGRVTKLIRPKRADQALAGYDAYTYDEADNRIKHDALATSAGAVFTDKASFDALGRLTRTDSAENRWVTYQYEYDITLTNGVASGAVGGWKKTTTNNNTSNNIVTDYSDAFGRQVRHIDLGGRDFKYTYNGAGWLINQKGTLNSTQNIDYAYYADGRIKSLTDTALGSYTLYKYDKGGNRTYEGYAKKAGTYWSSYQQAEISYDEQNRVREIKDPQYRVTYQYDAVGNRRRVSAFYGSSTTTPAQDYWYKYDYMNRFTVSMGKLENGAITQGTSGDGVLISYDKLGQRTQVIVARDNHREDYSYTNDGYLYESFVGTNLLAKGNKASTRTSDLLGRVTDYVQYASNGTTVNAQASRSYVYDKDGKVKSDTSNGITTTYDMHLDGTLKTTSYASSGTTYKTYYEYEWWDNAKQKTIKIEANNSGVQNWKPGTSEFQYDVNGHVVQVYDRAASRSLRYATNAQGLILVRDEVGSNNSVNKTQRFFYFNGNRVGEVGNDAAAKNVDYAQALTQAPVDPQTAYKNWQPIRSADFDQNYQPISPTYPGFTSAGYTARGGESLQEVAQTVWGDASMWYLLADANGLTSTTPLEAGQVLVIPNKVTNVHNTSTTARPYDAAKAMGDISPTLPDPPPPPAEDEACGGLGALLMAVVSIAVAVFVGPAAVELLGPIFGGAAAGAAGSVASQLVGKATGVIEHFSWRDVARGAISGGVTGGLDGVNFGISNELGAAMARATVGNVITQGVGVITGLQQKFDWRGVAASAVGSGAAYGAGQLWNSAGVDFGSAAANKIAGQTLGGVFNGAAQSLVFRQRPDWTAIAINSFGNALGDAVVGSIRQADASKVPPPVSADERAQILAGFADGPGGDSPALSPVYGRTFAEDRAVRTAMNAMPKAAAPVAPAGEEPFDFRRESLRANARSAAEEQARSDFRRSEITAGNAAAKAKDLARQAAAASARNKAADFVIGGSVSGMGPSFSDGLRGQVSLYSANVSSATMRSQMSAGGYYGSLAEGASNAQYVSAMLDAGLDAGGKAAGAAKLLPAGALQQARVEALMSAKNLEAAQALIKGPTAKSALAMAEYGGKYAGTFKALPYLGATLSIAEEANRVYRADGWQETTKVASVGVGNYLADGAVTTGGAWAGAKAGALGGAVLGSFVPVLGTGAGAVIGGVVGTIGGAVGGHWVYDSKIAPEVRAKVVGEKFRDAD